jgi:hypothetical protein
VPDRILCDLKVLCRRDVQAERRARIEAISAEEIGRHVVLAAGAQRM